MGFERWNALRDTIFVAAVIATSGTCAVAEQMPHTFGAMTLSLDGRVWGVIPEGPTQWRLEPADDQRRDFATIRVSVERLERTTTCAELAQARLAMSPYAGTTTSEVIFAGIKAVRAQAHTRCRNATPAGVVVCIPYAGHAHVFAETTGTCRTAGNPFAKGGVERILATARPVDR